MGKNGILKGVADMVTGCELYGILGDSSMTKGEAVRCIAGIGVLLLACWACG